MRNQSELGPCWALFLLFLVGAANVSLASSSYPFSPRRIRQWIQQKCGKDGAAVWVYEGALYDPLDGHKIANVEGLELVRQLSDSSDELSACRSKELKAFNMTQKADYSTTLLSRRLFCYQSPQQPRRLLDSIRLRPNAPLRKIPVHQAVAVYDSATTYAMSGDQLILHTEWPNRKCAWGIATTTLPKNDQHDNNSLDFAVFSKPSNSIDVPDISTLSSSSTTNDVVVAPKRSQLIQFGSPKQASSNQGTFGVRETYSYSSSIDSRKSRPRDWLDRLLRTSPPEQVSVKYTRYGEGPPWYGAGKYCMLELQGRRVASVEQAPPLAASIAAQRVPGFLSVNTPILSDASGKRAMEWFRQGHFELSEDNVEEQEVPTNRFGRLAYHVKQKSANVFSKVRAASTLEQSSGN